MVDVVEECALALLMCTSGCSKATGKCRFGESIRLFRLERRVSSIVATVLEILCRSSCPCCQRHESTIQSLQQQILSDANYYRKLLQMPLVDSSSVSVSKSPATTAADPSIDIVPSVPAMHTRRTLESMPPEILDRIVSFVSGNDILQLCHAVRYFKYISRAMFDFASLLKMDFDQRVEMFSFWPRLMLDGLPIPVPVSHLHVLQTYSSILPKHGGYASIDDSTGIELIISALPENVEVSMFGIRGSTDTDPFFGALCNAKKCIRMFEFGPHFFTHCEANPA